MTISGEADEIVDVHLDNLGCPGGTTLSGWGPMCRNDRSPHVSRTLNAAPLESDLSWWLSSDNGASRRIPRGASGVLRQGVIVSLVSVMPNIRRSR
jgi:hypothetical protein